MVKSDCFDVFCASVNLLVYLWDTLYIYMQGHLKSKSDGRRVGLAVADVP